MAGKFRIAAADYVFGVGEDAGEAILQTTLQLDAMDVSK